MKWNYSSKLQIPQNCILVNYLSICTMYSPYLTLLHLLVVISYFRKLLHFDCTVSLKHPILSPSFKWNTYQRNVAPNKLCVSASAGKSKWSLWRYPFNNWCYWNLISNKLAKPLMLAFKSQGKLIRHLGSISEWNREVVWLQKEKKAGSRNALPISKWCLEKCLRDWCVTDVHCQIMNQSADWISLYCQHEQFASNQ